MIFTSTVFLATRWMCSTGLRLAGPVSTRSCACSYLPSENAERVEDRVRARVRSTPSPPALNLDGEHLRLAVLPLLQFVAAAGQLQAAVSPCLCARLVDRVEIRVEPAEHHDRLVLADVLQRVGQELLFGLVDAVLDAVVGRRRSRRSPAGGAGASPWRWRRSPCRPSRAPRSPPRDPCKCGAASPARSQ